MSAGDDGSEPRIRGEWCVRCAGRTCTRFGGQRQRVPSVAGRPRRAGGRVIGTAPMSLKTVTEVARRLLGLQLNPLMAPVLFPYEKVDLIGPSMGGGWSRPTGV